MATSHSRLPSNDFTDPSPSNQPGQTSNSAALLRLDGGFEAVVGLLLLATQVTGLGWLLALPRPLTGPVALIAGLLLILLLPLLWRLSRRPSRRLLLALATANALGAVVLVLWVWRSNSTFHLAGALFILLVAGVLALLAVLQAGAAQKLAVSAIIPPTPPSAS
jgi:hypothetical protein